MKIKFRNFKGLYTNIDTSDKPVEYFSKFKDIKVYPGYIESKGLSFTEEAYGIPEGHTFIRQQYVFLDEDKYQNMKVGGDVSEFVCDRDDIIIDLSSKETSGKGHTYTVELVPQPAGLPDETSYFRWKMDGRLFSDPIAINYDVDYTQVWFEVINGLKIKFLQSWYGIPTPVRQWDITSNVTAVTELTNNYVQNIQKYLFQITYLDGHYHFYANGIEINNSPFADVPHQYPKIINEQGTLKVLMKSKALWVGMINRSYWNGDGTITTIPKGFYIYPLVEQYLESSGSSLFKFNVETDTSLPTLVNVDPGTIFTTFPFIHQGIARTLDAVAIELLKDSDGNQIRFSNYTGMLILGKVMVYGLLPCIAFWKGHTDIIPEPSTTISPDPFQFLYWKLDKGTHPVGSALTNKTIDDEPYWYPEDNNSNFRDPEQWVFFQTDNDFSIPQTLTNWLNDPTLAVNITAINLEKYFTPGSDIELLTTIIINNNEYVVNLEIISNAVAPFVVTINPNTSVIKEAYKNKISANIYFRYRDDLTDTNDKEFEFCYGVQFITGYNNTYPLYINKLTPNGIFLTQMIGKFFDPLTYKIITAFDDYANVAGIPYILKNSNVHFPAVGGGSILNNFYYENVVPGIEGERLIALTNLLGVFSGTKELMTLIDFSPVESSMIFYIKDTLQYRIRDEKDIAETPEGTFIHLKEGIYVTNGRERTLISEPINDLVRKHYKNASIFYNSYWKQLYYYTGTNLYCFDFETQSWCEYSMPKDWDKNNLIDFIEDFEGKIFFIAKDKSYQLEFESKEGILELSYLDLQEYSIGKRINYLVADHTGEIKAIDVTANGATRAIRYLFNKLDNRKPLRNITVEIKFNGTLYGIEMDIETMRIEQL